MSNHLRVAKVLAALLISMTGGAIVLMALGNNPPSAGPFCLASYYHLDLVEEAITSQAAHTPGRWTAIEVYYSKTQSGNLKQLASLHGFRRPDGINCHFCLCNGHGGPDGQIETSKRWNRQYSALPAPRSYKGSRTIRVCIVADGEDRPPTKTQIKRTQLLIRQLCRRFSIDPQLVHYPDSWW